MRAGALAVLLAVSASAQPVPALSGRVVDAAGVLSPSAEAAVTARLAAHEDSTSNQVVVLTIPSLDGADLETYANRAFRTWGLGQAATDNGVLLLVSRDDRQLRIEVGYGLEGVLTDAESSSIIRNVIVPRFRDGDHDGGVLGGVDLILNVLGRDGAPPGVGAGPAFAAPPPPSPWRGGAIGIALVLLVAAPVLYGGLVRDGVSTARSPELALLSAFAGGSIGVSVYYLTRWPEVLWLTLLAPLVVVPINLHLERHPTRGPARRARRWDRRRAAAEAHRRREAEQVALARRRPSSGSTWGGSSDWDFGSSGSSSRSSGGSSSSSSSSSRSSSFRGGGGSSGGGGASGRW